MAAPSLAPGPGAGAAPAGGQQGKIITVPGIPGHFIQVAALLVFDFSNFVDVCILDIHIFLYR